MSTRRSPRSRPAPPDVAPLPQALEAERATLGAALQNTAIARELVARLQPHHFFQDAHAFIREAIGAALDESRACTPLTVAEQLKREGRLTTAVEGEYLQRLVDQTVTTAGWEAHAELVRRTWQKRHALDAAKALSARLEGNGLDPGPALADFWETTRGIEEPTRQAQVEREGDDFLYAWPLVGVEIRLARLRDGLEGIQGEIGVEVDGRPVHWGRLNLPSLSAREALVSKLHRDHSKLPWREMLEEPCRETAARLRASLPTVQLHPAPARVERFLVDKLILAHETNVHFADGGSGKSLTAQALAVAILAGKTLPAGLVPHEVGPTLYLDWESCREEHEERLAGLLCGLGVAEPVPLYYRRMLGALADELPAIRQEVARLKPVLVVVDSLAPACGAEPESADAAIRCLNALRSLPCSRLVLAHVSKLQADQRGAARPFGSVFVQNLPRNVWELRRAEEEGETDALTVGVYHRKANRGKLLSPFGLRYEFSEHAIRVRNADLAQDATLRERAGLPYSILAVLRAGKMTIEQITEELEASESGVKKALYRLEKAGKVLRVSGPGHGPGRPVEWGLKE